MRVSATVVVTALAPALAVVVALLGGCSLKGSTATAKTASQATLRRQFLEDFIAKTQIREAHISASLSPQKWRGLNSSGFLEEVDKLNLAREFEIADTEDKLLRALLKLNNARKDRHLKFSLSGKTADAYAPVKFYPDFSRGETPFFFVANLDRTAFDTGVRRGDKLVAVNGYATARYLEMLAPYLRYSTLRHMYIKEAPVYLSARHRLFTPALYLPDNEVTYTLNSLESGENYSVTLSYTHTRARNINWLHPRILELDREDYREDEEYYRRQYARHGFEKLFDNHNDCALYVNHALRQVLIEWYHFNDTRDSVAQLVRAAEAENILDYDVIVDATHSGGGGNSALLVQVLAPRPFKTTFGNMRVSDRAFTRDKMRQHAEPVQAWIERALAADRAFTTNEPFKLMLFPAGSDGVMQPAEKRFTGKKVVLLFTLGGSNLDQFASMIIDNPQLDIHTLGMPTGGYSNTWEWGEKLEVPGLGPVNFEWDMGHTLRPNGEVLEGNPARPAEIIPFTRANYSDYFDNLINMAKAHLAGQVGRPAVQ